MDGRRWQNSCRGVLRNASDVVASRIIEGYFKDEFRLFLKVKFKQGISERVNKSIIFIPLKLKLNSLIFFCCNTFLH